MNGTLLRTSILLCFIGCAPTKGYLGPVRPPNEVAVIKGLIRDHTRVYIYQLDDIIKGGFLGTTLSKIDVLPGKHLIGIVYNFDSPERTIHRFNCVATFTAEAGHIYQLYARQSHLSPMSAWIKDVNTSQTVGRCEQKHPDVFKRRKIDK